MGIEICDGNLFRRLFVGGVRWVAFHRDLLNDMNVYPVPDGDTGINMYLTLRSATSAFRLAKDSSISEALQSISRGALLGAKGNSGVILSQVLAGFAKAFKGKDSMTASDLAEAFSSASDRAYKCVSEPKEGTILTVVRHTADMLKDYDFGSEDLGQALYHIHSFAEKTLKSTRDENPVLKKAGVLDAGGQGLIFLLEGMLRTARFEDIKKQRMDRVLKEVTRPKDDEALKFRFCTEFIVELTVKDVDKIRTELENMGGSLATAACGDLLKIHIHTNQPELVRAYVSSLGEIIREKRDDMHKQHRKLQFRDELTVRNESLSSSFSSLNTALAAIVSGEGLIDVFEGSGAYVIPGGQSMNPSVQEIASILEKIPARDILLLPNNSNCIPACDLAAGLVDRNIFVLPTKDVVTGLMFLSLYDPARPIAELTKRYYGTRDSYTTIEFCRAVKDGQLPEFNVEEGDWMAICNGSLICVSETFDNLIDKVSKIVDTCGRSRLTVIEGIESIPGTNDPLRLVRDRFDLEANYIYGGQKHYPLLIGIE